MTTSVGGTVRCFPPTEYSETPNRKHEQYNSITHTESGQRQPSHKRYHIGD